MSNQTAVEWLFKRLDVLESYTKSVSVIATKEQWLDLYQKALAMEKEQIVDARENGLNEGVTIANNPYYTKWLLNEDFYNETYKGGSK